MKHFCIFLLVSALLQGFLSFPGFCASHNDAPLIMQDPGANITDVYAFIGLNDRDQKVLNILVTVNPLEDPGNGILYYRFPEDVLYGIHIVKATRKAEGGYFFTGEPAITYNFLFKTELKNVNTAVSYGLGTEGGPILSVGDGRQNLVQTYSVEKVLHDKRQRILLSEGKRLLVPPPNVGPRTTPLYYDSAGNLIQGALSTEQLDRYTQETIYTLSDGTKVFAGQRDDGFYADVPAIFDFLGIRDPGRDGFSGYNVHAIALQIPVSQLVGPEDVPVVGVFATTSRTRVTLRRAPRNPLNAGAWIQVGRMGNPLFNEVLVALRDKDRYNQESPVNDEAIFKSYAENPELASLLNAVLGTKFQNKDRSDLVQVFIPDLLKVDTSTGPVPLAGQPGFSRLSLFGGDTVQSAFTGGPVPSGWPNGRRLGDDVVDIALTAIASGPSYKEIIPVGDNVNSNDVLYHQVFPYAATPQGGPVSSLHAQATVPPPPAVVLGAVLRGDQEAPTPVTTSAKGTATITISPFRNEVLVSVSTEGLKDVVAAHIHVGSLGQAGPIIFPLYAAAEGPFTGTLTKRLTKDSFTPAGGINTFEEAINALLSGRTYVNIHTKVNPAGEIRGQIGPVALTASLSGTEEVPPVTTTATGTASIEINATQTEISVTLNTQGLQDVTAAHIHIGPPGQAGPIIFPLYSASEGPFPATLVKKLTSAHFQPAGGLSSFADAVNALLTRKTYVNVHTKANPGGEIRGQVVP